MIGLGQEAIVAWGGCPNLTYDVTPDDILVQTNRADAFYDMIVDTC